MAGLLINEKELEHKILVAYAKALDKAIRKAKRHIQKRVKNILKTAILESKEYSSLIGGRLQFELGVDFPVQRMNDIISVLVESVSVNVDMRPQKRGRAIKMQIEIVGGGLRDMSDSTQLAAASVMSTFGLWEWWKILTTKGDSTVVIGYRVSPANRYELAFSRSNHSIMRKKRVHTTGCPLNIVEGPVRT